MVSQKSLLLGKLRQSNGANAILCNKAADEIVAVRRQREDLLDVLARVSEYVDNNEDCCKSTDGFALVEEIESRLVQHGRKATL